MTKKNIALLIDDDVVLLKMAEEMLRDSYDVSLAKSGENALRLLTRGFYARHYPVGCRYAHYGRL
jgi:hypothetical protein